MVLQKTNIEEKLHRKRKASENQENERLNEVYKILANVDLEKERLEKNLQNVTYNHTNSFVFDLLDTSKIYHLNEIKNICIDYRLRFLDTKYFKGEIPQEAFSKIKDLEKTHCIELQSFKIIAPSKLFKLEDKDDPLLFAPIGNGYFYLIHQWGDDLHPLRKMLMWPFKNMVNLALLVFMISFIATLMIPSGLFSKSSSSAEFWIMFFFMFKCIASVVIFYGFALGKNFNPAIWNSKYFNS